MDNSEKAFDFALTMTKQVVTLSTGILALMITFLSDIVSDVGLITRIILLLSWSLFLVSVGFGVFTMMALTGNLDPKNWEENFSLYGSSIQTYSKIQMTTFFLGMLLAVIFGVLIL